MKEKITICSVGDLMICDSPLYASVGAGSKYPSYRKNFIKACKQQFEGADVIVGNFETVVYEPKNKSLKEMQMACPESVIEDLKKAGFSVLNLANNHCLQHGTEGFEKTRKACEKNGILPAGIRDEVPSVMEIKGKRLVFLSLCIHLEWYQPDSILYENRIERILAEVEEIRKKDASVVIIVLVHWGDEYAMYPSGAQIVLAHKLADLGANIILGHHSHVFQGVEEYNGTVIAYSQGNFVSDMVADICRETGIVRIEIDGNHIRSEVDAVYIDQNYVPVRTDGTWYKDRVSKLSQALEGQFSDDRYWNDIRKNHAVGHNDFKKYFKRNILRYRINVSSKMLLDFVKRKTKRVAGTSTDGRVSSMDPAIRAAVRNFDNK